MGRKIKKVIMIAAFGMVTGGQIADLLPEGNVMQVEAGSRKQIIKVKNKGKDSKKESDSFRTDVCCQMEWFICICFYVCSIRRCDISCRSHLTCILF